VLFSIGGGVFGCWLGVGEVDVVGVDMVGMMWWTVFGGAVGCLFVGVGVVTVEYVEVKLDYVVGMWIMICCSRRVVQFDGVFVVLTRCWMVVLIFDDGFDLDYILMVLDLFDWYYVWVMFFMVGVNVLVWCDLVCEVVCCGYFLGNYIYFYVDFYFLLEVLVWV